MSSLADCFKVIKCIQLKWCAGHTYTALLKIINKKAVSNPIMGIPTQGF